MLEHRLKRLEYLARRRTPPDQARSVEEMTDEELAVIIDAADPAAVLSMTDAELERGGRPDKRRRTPRPAQTPTPARRRRRLSTLPE